MPGRGEGSGESQDLGAVGGDGDRVLGVGRAAAVAAADGPAVVIDVVAVLAAGQEPWFDRDDQARGQPLAAAARSGVGDVRILVHGPADTVTAEVGADAVAARA